MLIYDSNNYLVVFHCAIIDNIDLLRPYLLLLSLFIASPMLLSDKVPSENSLQIVKILCQFLPNIIP